MTGLHAGGITRVPQGAVDAAERVLHTHSPATPDAPPGEAVTLAVAAILATLTGQLAADFDTAADQCDPASAATLRRLADYIRRRPAGAHLADIVAAVDQLAVEQRREIADELADRLTHGRIPGARIEAGEVGGTLWLHTTRQVTDWVTGTLREVRDGR